MEPCCKQFPLAIELECCLVHGPYDLVGQSKVSTCLDINLTCVDE